jgi:hypothetical protein
MFLQTNLVPAAEAAATHREAGLRRLNQAAQAAFAIRCRGGVPSGPRQAWATPQDFTPHPEFFMPNPLVLINSGAATSADAQEIVLPYLDHFGVPYELLDVMRQPLPPDLAARPLIIVAQRDLDARRRRLGGEGRAALAEAVERGAGLISFDPALLDGPGEATNVPPAETVVVADASHPITARHAPGETLALVGTLHVPTIAADGQVLLEAGARPLLVVRAHGRGRVALWATPRWASTRVLGPLAGLDDVLWRSIVWAARKPFVLRGLPPLVAMRVDDVAGTGERWERSPLFWAQEAARHGFKPWLGLFLGNLGEAALRELHAMLDAGAASAFPHAFGRPARGDNGPWRYEPPLALRASSYDEFIYFDHQRGEPWSDAEAARGLAAVDAWYEAHGRPPISRYAVAHWYEQGANTVAHMVDRWGVEFTGKIQDVDAPLRDETPWLRLGPFRRHEQPGTSLFEPTLRGDRPVYYADFVNFGGRRLFNCVTEIRDDAGYEWVPDADVPASVGRGVRQLRRALDSMALAVLFTHETDFIHRIPPAAWDEQLGQIVAGISSYRPRFVTLDDGARIVRATKTSRLAAFDSGTTQIVLTGVTDVATAVYVFDESDDALDGRLVEVPAFEEQLAMMVG